MVIIAQIIQGNGSDPFGSRFLSVNRVRGSDSLKRSGIRELETSRVEHDLHKAAAALFVRHGGFTQLFSLFK